MANKYFKVTCKCGHVGVKHFIRISFPIISASRKDASKIARYLPRVKHEHKDAILDCKEITYEEFIELRVINENDPYLKCTNKQEQEMIEDFYLRLEDEPRYIHEKLFEEKKDRLKAKLKLKKQACLDAVRWQDHVCEEDFINNECYSY